MFQIFRTDIQKAYRYLSYFYSSLDAKIYKPILQSLNKLYDSKLKLLKH